MCWDSALYWHFSYEKIQWKTHESDLNWIRLSFFVGVCFCMDILSPDTIKNSLFSQSLYRNLWLLYLGARGRRVGDSIRMRNFRISYIWILICSCSTMWRCIRTGNQSSHILITTQNWFSTYLFCVTVNIWIVMISYFSRFITSINTQNSLICHIQKNSNIGPPIFERGERIQKQHTHTISGIVVTLLAITIIGKMIAAPNRRLSLEFVLCCFCRASITVCMHHSILLFFL